jgi:hypothetical protein
MECSLFTLISKFRTARSLFVIFLTFYKSQFVTQKGETLHVIFYMVSLKYSFFPDLLLLFSVIVATFLCIAKAMGRTSDVNEALLL